MLPSAVQLLPTPRSSDTNGGGVHGDGGLGLRTTVALLPTPGAWLAEHRRDQGQDPEKRRAGGHQVSVADVACHAPDGWGDYAAAIHRHERLTGRAAPPPTEPGRNGNPRLSARFAEWMMCLPDGWVTDVPSITRNEALKALGNGVIPLQAEHAIRHMLTRTAAAA